MSKIGIGDAWFTYISAILSLLLFSLFKPQAFIIALKRKFNNTYVHPVNEI